GADTRLRYFCSPQHSDSALYPIIGQLERAAGLARDDTQQAKLDKLDAVLAQSSTSAQDAALIAEMLSLPNDGRYPEWASMTRFGMLGTGTCMSDTIPLCVLCRLRQPCNGSWGIRRKENSRNATQLIWRGVCSMRRHWLMRCGLFAKPRLLAVMLPRL